MAERRVKTLPRMKTPAPPQDERLMRGIIVGAAVIVVAGLVWAALLGHLFS